MKNSFSAKIDKIVANTEKRMVLVMQSSLQDMVDAMQTPVAKGGKMRVDTGFLRASGQSSLNGMPTGPSINPSKTPSSLNWSRSDTEVTINQITFGSTFFFGWTANYAKYREAFDGFMDSNLQNWQQFVDATIEKVKKRYKL